MKVNLSEKDKSALLLEERNLSASTSAVDTTLNLDTSVIDVLGKISEEAGVSFSAVVNYVLRIIVENEKGGVKDDHKNKKHKQ